MPIHLAIVDDEDSILRLFEELLTGMEQDVALRCFLLGGDLLEAMTGGYRPDMIFVDHRLLDMRCADLVGKALAMAGEAGGVMPRIHVICGAPELVDEETQKMAASVVAKSEALPRLRGLFEGTAAVASQREKAGTDDLAAIREDIAKFRASLREG